MKQIALLVTLIALLADTGAAQGSWKHWVIQPPKTGVYTGADGGPMSREGSCEGVSRAAGATMQFCDSYYTIYNLPQILTDGRTSAMSASGTIPVVTLGCAGNGTPFNGGRTTYSEIASGARDTALRADAAALKAYAARFPKLPWVMMRPFHEFNVNIGNPPNHPNRNNCYSMPEGVSDMQNEFKAAFQHVFTLFASEGVTNVTWLWCPAIGPRVWRRYGGNDLLRGFYPGDAYVDWTCADTYDSPAPGGGLRQAFANIGFFKQFHKPLIIAETAECNREESSRRCGGYAHSQAEFINDLRTALEPGGMLADAGVKAWMYFDQNVPYSGFNWSFDSSGLSAFRAMITAPYFHPSMPRPVLMQ